MNKSQIILSFIMFSWLAAYPVDRAFAAAQSEKQVPDRNAMEKRWYELLDISAKYFPKPGSEEKIHPTAKDDAATTLRLLAEAPPEDYYTRFYALQILGKTAPPEARDIVLRNLQDSQPDIKVAAIRALGDYIKASNDFSLVPTLIDTILINVSYYVDRFEGGRPTGKLYPKSEPNCGLNIITVNEEAAMVLESVLGRKPDIDHESNRRASVMVGERKAARTSIEREAKNYKVLQRLRNQYLEWWNTTGKVHLAVKPGGQ